MKKEELRSKGFYLFVILQGIILLATAAISWEHGCMKLPLQYPRLCLVFPRSLGRTASRPPWRKMQTIRKVDSARSKQTSWRIDHEDIPDSRERWLVDLICYSPVAQTSQVESIDHTFEKIWRRGKHAWFWTGPTTLLSISSCVLTWLIWSIGEGTRPCTITFPVISRRYSHPEEPLRFLDMARRNPSGKKPSFPLDIQPSIDLVVANLHFIQLDGVWFKEKTVIQYPFWRIILGLCEVSIHFQGFLKYSASYRKFTIQCWKSTIVFSSS